jgi:hypothetical protein
MIHGKVNSMAAQRDGLGGKSSRGARRAYRPYTVIDQVPILPFRQDKLRVDQYLAHAVLGIAAAYRRPLIAAEQPSETVTAI